MAGWFDKEPGDAYITQKFDITSIYPYLSSYFIGVSGMGRSSFWKAMTKMGLLVSTDVSRNRNVIRQRIHEK